MEVDRRRTRRWAKALARGDDPALAAAGRTVLSLLDAAENGAAPDLERLARMQARARAATQASDPDLRAAGRRVLELVDELETRAAFSLPFAEAPAAPEPEPAPPRERAPRPRPSLPRGRAAYVIAAVVLALALVAGAIVVARAVFTPSLDGSGPSGELLGRATFARAVFRVDGSARDLREQHWTLDGRDVTSHVQAQNGRLVYRPTALAEGPHEVAVKGGRNAIGLSASRTFSFRVDTTPPPIRIVGAPSARAWEPLRLAGSAPGATRLTVDGRAAVLDGDRFVVRRTPPVPTEIVLDAVDEAGNRASRRVKIALVPRRPPVPVRAVHVTFYAWADRTLRAGVMQLIDERRINAVELDLKDESGLVGFGPKIPYAQRIGSVRRIYDLDKAVRELHARGIRVIGRLVCFRDPVHAAAAWKAGRRGEVIQTPGGEPYAGYGGFTNFASPTVRRYNIDVAVAAARAGVDDVLYDYVRRPDGPRSSMTFPGLQGTPEDGIVEFLRESRAALRPYRTYLGASVFGVAATRPLEVAQPIRRMAAQVDYVAPMVYPSHWGPGEYDVANPNAQPYDIVRKSLLDFSRDVRGAGARIVPWLQDFSLGVDYGPAEVRAQIDAARRDGIVEFLLWDAGVTYTRDALTPNAPTSKKGLARPWTGPAPTAVPVAAKPTREPRSKPTPKLPEAAPVRAVDGRMPNELGVVPVIMHHEIRPDRVGPYDQTPAEFRAELARLWREGYWPVTAAQLVTRSLGRVPAGKTPVVLTFDDATQYQLRFKGGFRGGKGTVDPTTAIGVLLEFARTHPGFPVAGTFYVLREPFAGVPDGPAMLRWLVKKGFELGNHTYDHTPLNTLDSVAVQKELARGEQVLTGAVPDYRVRTMALPLGAMPDDASLARRGRWGGRSYGSYGVLLVGANPASSPYSTAFDPGAIPRIRSSHAGWNGEADMGASYWLHQLEQNPAQRYVSDGDPKRLTFPRAKAGELAPAFRARARPY
jgi:peptidoglycan/xylan/chitin deacetylase (PgdA/CDA1 family)